MSKPDFLDEPKNKRARVSVPPLAGADVRALFAEMLRQGRTMDWCESYSGVRRAAMKTWRVRSKPSLESIQSVFATLGFHYVPAPVPKVLAPDIARDLADLARRMEADMPQTFAALISIAAKQRVLAEKAQGA